MVYVLHTLFLQQSNVEINVIKKTIRKRKYSDRTVLYLSQKTCVEVDPCNSNPGSSRTPVFGDRDQKSNLGRGEILTGTQQESIAVPYVDLSVISTDAYLPRNSSSHSIRFTLCRI